MRFKPRCFDYHTEATNLLREGHQKKQTRKIRISTWAIDIESSNEKENDSSISMEETSPVDSLLPVCSGRNIFAGSPRVGLVAKGVAVVNEAIRETNNLVSSRKGESVKCNHDEYRIKSQSLLSVSMMPMKRDKSNFPLSAGTLRPSLHSSFTSEEDVDMNTSSFKRRRESNIDSDDNKRSRQSVSSVLLIPSRRQVKIYDFPWLVTILSSIRRQCNQRRIAEKACFNPYCKTFCRKLFPLSRTIWLRMVDHALFCQLCYVSSLSAAAKLRLLGPTSKLPERAVKNEETGVSTSKKPYRYCLLDILQDEIGKFMPRPLGSREDRAETLRRELKALVVYQPVQNVVKQIQDSYHCAFLTAVCILKYQKSQESKEGGKMKSPEKRKSIGPDHNKQVERLTKKSKLQMVQHDPSSGRDKVNSITPAKRKLSSCAPLPSSTRRHRPSPHSQAFTKTISAEQKETEAKAKEMLLLERFGLAPQGFHNNDSKMEASLLYPKLNHRDMQLSKKACIQPGQNNGSILQLRVKAAPPLRCDSPSSLDYKLKQQTKRTMKKEADLETRDDRKLTFQNLPPNEEQVSKRKPESLVSHLKQSKRSLGSHEAIDSAQETKNDKAQRLTNKERRKQARKLVKKLKKAKRKLEKDMKRNSGKKGHDKTPSPARATKTYEPDTIHVKHVKVTSGQAAANLGPRSRTQYERFGISESPKTQKISPPPKKKDTVSTSRELGSLEDGTEPQFESLDSLQLLCSETFLETWGEAVAKLASGGWKSTNTRARKICFLDTSLVDKCGVDIEVPGRGGIIVSSLSSLNGPEFPVLVKRVVGLISMSRYRYLEVLLCVEADQDDSILKNIVTLQNAVLHDRGPLGSAVSFAVVSPCSLATSIGNSMRMHKSHKDFEGIETYLSDDRTFERLNFLISLVPTFTASTALHCLASSKFSQETDGDRSKKWFRELLGRNNHERNRMNAMRDPLGNVSQLLNPAVVTQLSLVLSMKVPSHQN